MRASCCSRGGVCPCKEGAPAPGKEKDLLVSLSGHSSPVSSPPSLRDRPFAMGVGGPVSQAGDWSLSMRSHIPRTDLGRGWLVTIACTSSLTARPPCPHMGTLFLAQCVCAWGPRGHSREALGVRDRAGGAPGVWSSCHLECVAVELKLLSFR